MSKQPIKPRTDNKPAGTYHEVGPRGGKFPMDVPSTLIGVIVYPLLKSLDVVGLNDVWKPL